MLSGEHDSAGLFVARDKAGQVCGAVLAQALPGALGVVWPPCGDSPEAEDALAAAACGWLRGRGVKVCQAFAAANEKPDMAPLARAGFQHITQLVLMRRELSPPPPLLYPPARSLTITPEPRPHSPGFRATLLATYEATRDCPELNGGRTPDELLAGLADPTPAMDCYMATAQEGAVGVLMLSAVPVLGAVDLAYLGVVASARGQGFGGEVLRFAITEALRGRADALTLSVDARNDPALRLYRCHEFVETDRREVWLAELGTINDRA
jgi:mycothiol synthase